MSESIVSKNRRQVVPIKVVKQGDGTEFLITKIDFDAAMPGNTSQKAALKQ